MTDVLIRQMPEEIHRRLKQRADRNRRSVNQEILILLEDTLDQAEDDKPPIPPTAFRGAFPINDQLLYEARTEGRA